MTNLLKHTNQSLIYALATSLVIISALLAIFFVAEPSVGHVQTFYVRQTITGESSFAVPPTNVTMSGSIAGVTGGAATGTTQFVVTSNNTSGYTVDIDFFDNTTDQAMLGDSTASESIIDYTGIVSGTNPSLLLATTSSAEFAYTVMSTTSSDTGPLFLDNTTLCGTGGTDQSPNECWMAPSTTVIVIVDRDSSAPTGATSTVFFNVTIPAGAVPVPVSDTYTATATLTLTEK